MSVGQLKECGLDGSAIRRRTRKGRLHRVHRGVYAVGHDALTPRASFVAAVLACGGGAVLSHYSTAAHWGYRVLRITWHQAVRHPQQTLGRIRAARGRQWSPPYVCAVAAWRGAYYGATTSRRRWRSGPRRCG